MSHLKPAAIIVVALTLFVVVGWNLEIDDDFEAARASLSSNSRTLGLYQSYTELIDEHGLDTDLLADFPGTGEPLLSTVLTGADDHVEGWPLLALAVLESDLHDPYRGIMANPLKRGRSWERTGQVSYYENGELLVSSRVGVRMHGGDERRANSAVPMFRLYFRGRYLSSAERAAVLHGPDGQPASRWVIRHPPQAHFFSNAFAFEIARRNGALTPQYKPVKFFLNGRYRGDYLLIEQINREGWGSSFFDHDDYLLFVYREAGSPDAASVEAYRELDDWAADPAVDMTMAEAARRIDIENYVLHILTFAFTGERDPYQGAVFLDQTEPEPRWKWLHYDLDNSFIANGVNPPVIDPHKLAFRLFTEATTGERGNDIRAVLFKRLILDPEFRAYFTDLVLDRVNHRIDRQFLEDLVERYAFTGGPGGDFNGIDISEFFRRRRSFIVTDLENTAGSGPIRRIIVDPAKLDSRYTVDGYEKQGRYSGWLREGDTLLLELTSFRRFFTHWLVDDEIVEGERIELQVTADTTIRPVFSQ